MPRPKSWCGSGPEPVKTAKPAVKDRFGSMRHVKIEMIGRLHTFTSRVEKAEAKIDAERRHLGTHQQS